MNIYELIKKHEGLRLKPYTCPTGHLTIGYGHNLEANGITEDIAEKLLIQDVEAATLAVIDLVPTYHDLSDNRKMALIDMCFNMGKFGLAKFKKFLQAIAEHNWVEASAQLVDSTWYTQVGTRAETVVQMIREG